MATIDDIKKRLIARHQDFIDRQKLDAMRTKVIPTTKTALVALPAFAMAITAAKIHHAVMSSTAAIVIINEPNAVRFKPLSCTILAKTGKAVMLIDMPINKANT